MSTFIDNSDCNNNNTNNNITTTNSNDINNNDNTNEEENEPFGLLSFSIDIMSIILTQFLTIYDVGKLDTAYCNKKKRIQLLNILSNDESIQYNHLTFNDSNKLIDNLLIWIGNRKIKILELSNDEKPHLYNVLTGDRLLGFKSFLTDDGLLGLSRHCIHLKSLNISGCKNITDTSLTEIGRNSIHLKSLNISGCNSITDTVMIEISRNCIHLESLNISGCKNIDTREIQRLFPNVVLQ